MSVPKFPHYKISDLVFKKVQVGPKLEVLGLKHGFYLIPTNIPNPGDYLYWIAENHSNRSGTGMAHFKLEDGSVVEEAGWWHTNSDALFESTGIDVRDKHMTWTAVLKASYGILRPIDLTRPDNVIVQDAEPTIGTFDREEDLARASEIADEWGHPVFFYKVTSGGSSLSQVKVPEERKFTQRT